MSFFPPLDDMEGSYLKKRTMMRFRFLCSFFLSRITLSHHNFLIVFHLFLLVCHCFFPAFAHALQQAFPHQFFPLLRSPALWVYSFPPHRVCVCVCSCVCVIFAIYRVKRCPWRTEVKLHCILVLPHYRSTTNTDTYTGSDIGKLAHQQNSNAIQTNEWVCQQL